MKEVTKYQCEVCFSWHESREEAVKCESPHCQRVMGEKGIALSYPKFGKFPYTISINFYDPSTRNTICVTYHKEKEYEH